jgi:hypothetical protein
MSQLDAIGDALPRARCSNAGLAIPIVHRLRKSKAGANEAALLWHNMAARHQGLISLRAVEV